MKKLCALLVALLVIMAGCSTTPNDPAPESQPESSSDETTAAEETVATEETDNIPENRQPEALYSQTTEELFDYLNDYLEETGQNTLDKEQIKVEDVEGSQGRYTSRIISIDEEVYLSFSEPVEGEYPFQVFFFTEESDPSAPALQQLKDLSVHLIHLLEEQPEDIVTALSFDEDAASLSTDAEGIGTDYVYTVSPGMVFFSAQAANR